MIQWQRNHIEEMEFFHEAPVVLSLKNELGRHHLYTPPR